MNKLTLIKKVDKLGYGLFKCECGTEKIIRINAVNSNGTKSCGCWRIITARNNGKKVMTHNMTNHKLYRMWHLIKNYCNPKNSKYINTTICDAWKNDYLIFYNWCIENFWEENKTVFTDSGHYSPETCKILASNESKEINRKKTNLKIYGVENPVVLEETKEKNKNTCLERYGEISYSKTKEAKEKAEATSLKKYGYKHHTYRESFKQDARLRSIENNQAFTYLGKTTSQWAKELGISGSALINRIHKFGFEKALKIPLYQTSIEQIIEDILIKNNIIFEKNKTIENYKCDFIINNKIIIECDGLYWHSELKKKNNYHKKKRAKYIELGYTPLFFREDEIEDSQDIVESIIKNKLQMSTKIYARKCSVELINKKDGSEFLQKNHLMGSGAGKCIALKYEGKIVSVMRIKKLKNGYDISRFAHEIGLNVIGGFSKILSWIKINLKPEFIQTFIDLRYGSGEYLSNFGFVKSTEYLSFKWVENNKTYGRMSYPNNTGYDFGLYKIWDCGQAKWVYKYV